MNTNLVVWLENVLMRYGKHTWDDDGFRDTYTLLGFKYESNQYAGCLYFMHHILDIS